MVTSKGFEISEMIDVIFLESVLLKSCFIISQITECGLIICPLDWVHQ